MIGAWLTRLLGPHWRARTPMILAAFFMFVQFSPGDFARFPIIVHLAKFAALGGLVAFGLRVPDKGQIGK